MQLAFKSFPVRFAFMSFSGAGKCTSHSFSYVDIDGIVPCAFSQTYILSLHAQIVPEQDQSGECSSAAAS